jgi:hypothetical protein
MGFAVWFINLNLLVEFGTRKGRDVCNETLSVPRAFFVYEEVKTMKNEVATLKSGTTRRILPRKKVVIDAVKKILKSGNETVVYVMYMNIMACLSTIERKETIIELHNEIERLQRSIKE